MANVHSLRDVMILWETNVAFRTALKNAMDLNTFNAVLEAHKICLSPDELKKMESMLDLKNKTTLNINLEKKINK